MSKPFSSVIYLCTEWKTLCQYMCFFSLVLKGRLDSLLYDYRPTTYLVELPQDSIFTSLVTWHIWMCSLSICNTHTMKIFSPGFGIISILTDTKHMCYHFSFLYQGQTSQISHNPLFCWEQIQPANTS